MKKPANLLTDYPESVYKFRPFSPLILKELLYGEIYLSSNIELNDPYDAKTCYIFKPDPKRYVRLFDYILAQMKLEVKPLDFTKAALVLSRQEFSYEELIAEINTEDFKTKIDNIFIKSKQVESIALADIFVRTLKHEIHKRVGRYIYIASFSKIYNEPIMWSHYADKHRGCCLHFLPYENKLLRNPLKRKIKSSKADGAKKYFDENNFEFIDVKYCQKIQPIDAFLNFSEHIYGKKPSSRLIKNFWPAFMKSATIKHNRWKYEQEIRLVDYSHWMPSYVTENGASLRNSIERIYYYDQTQLRGIIFGSKMPQDDKNEIISAITKMRDWLFHECHYCLPVFMFNNAVQNSKKYLIDAVPYCGLDTNNIQFNIDKINEKIDEAERYLKIQKNQVKNSDIVHSHFK